MAVMQLSDPSLAELALIASEFVTLFLGLAISYIAYRGYRRNDSRPMLFIALGFVLVVGIPGVLGALFVFAGIGDRMVVAGVTQVSELAGMASIFYALRTTP
ncbi:hypothetical protein BRC81_08970 [Halobacteriales archaeon QS_1_68_20]|nr:MAG: hypothetical protein BRC81_08970 [Halobacteriales archaeon QS_1_68_20]